MKSKTRAKIKRIEILAFLLSTIIGIGIMAGIRGKPYSPSKVEARTKTDDDLEFEKYKKVR